MSRTGQPPWSPHSPPPAARCFMDELFEQLARGDIPNVIELMSAISELSNLYPGCEECQIQLKNPIKLNTQQTYNKRKSNTKKRGKV